MTSLTDLRLFATHPHTCSYLEDQVATTLFVDPDAKIDRSMYSKLSELGFRRSGQHLYRPDCGSCSACIPARIPVAYYKPNRQQRRCAKLNHDLSIRVIDDISAAEYYDLYQSYIIERHQDGDMFPPSRQQYHSFLTSEWGVTRYLEMRLGSQLVAIAVIDLLDNGISAVYTFFDPKLEKRSLGTFAVMAQIDIANQYNLNYVYLGYWIKACRKMAYKSKFQPLELYRANQWQLISQQD